MYIIYVYILHTYIYIYKHIYIKNMYIYKYMYVCIYTLYTLFKSSDNFQAH